MVEKTSNHVVVFIDSETNWIITVVRTQINEKPDYNMQRMGIVNRTAQRTVF